jgi:hypothetical protein
MMLAAIVGTLLGIAFVLFGIRAVMTIRGRPRDAGEVLRRWFGISGMALPSGATEQCLTAATTAEYCAVATEFTRRANRVRHARTQSGSGAPSLGSRRSPDACPDPSAGQRGATGLARRRDHGEVRRYVGTALIGAIALIACIGIRDLWFHNDFRRSPVTLPTEARSADGQVACQVEGRDFLTVPIFIGKPLAGAAAKARASGLQLVGTGVSGGDPDGATARVSAQEPPSGTRVPVGACIGFRTRT